MNLIKSTSFLSLCQFICYGLSFLRNLILARALSKSDFALVSVFAMTITFIEVGGRMAFGQQIVQSKSGDDPKFQATCQGLLLTLGIVAGTVIILTSGQIANLFGIPEQAWMFKCLAAVPIIRGFEHHDHHWLKRTFNLKPSAYSETIPHIVVTIGLVAAARFIHDASVILWVILSRAILTIIFTHVFAKRKYQIYFHKEYITTILLFSWPLALNGFLHFASTQADQFIIGTQLSLEDLSVYAVATSFTILPFFIFAPVINTITLPALSKHQDSQIDFNQLFYKSTNATALIASITLLPSSYIIQYAIPLLYGEKYTNIGHIVTILICACVIRLIRTTQGTADIAKAKPILQLLSNSVRALSIPLSLIFLSFSTSAESVAYANLIAEILALVYTVIMQSRKLNIPPSGVIRTILASVLSITTILIFSSKSSNTTFTDYALSFSFALVLVAIILITTSFKQTKDIWEVLVRQGTL